MSLRQKIKIGRYRRSYGPSSLKLTYSTGVNKNHYNTTFCPINKKKFFDNHRLRLNYISFLIFVTPLFFLIEINVNHIIFFFSWWHYVPNFYSEPKSLYIIGKIRKYMNKLGQWLSLLRLGTLQFNE